MRGDDWVTFDLPPDADLAGSGIYLWTIGTASYVGKAKHISSRRWEYMNNVRKIEAGLPYRKGRPDGFRAVHRALAEAKSAGQTIVWKLLERCEPGPVLLERERHWIAVLRPTLNGPTQRSEG